MTGQAPHQPLIFTSMGNMPLDELREAVVWSDIETPLAQAKATMLAKIAALEAAMAANNGPQFYVAMMDLKAAAQSHVLVDEIVCSVEHWIGDECVRRQVNIKKLNGEAATGAAQDFR